MFEFCWKVPENGFEWVRASPIGSSRTGEENDYLCQRGDEGKSNVVLEYQMYAPFENGALFKTFADLEPNDVEILAFATQYGRLGGFATTLVGRSARADDEDAGCYSVQAESLDIWKTEIIALHHAVQLWEALKNKDVTFLSRFIQWGAAGSSPKQVAEYNGPIIAFTGISETALSISPEIRSLFVPGDIIYPGWYALHELINYCLEIHQTTLRLLWQTVRGKLTRTIQIIPGSLIAAIWIQFAKAVEGDREYEQCQECKKWYEISGDRREGARFCSDPCRFKAYRKRQREAQLLHGAGVTPKEIAKRLGSDPKTVKGWISKGKRNGKTKTRKR